MVENVITQHVGRAEAQMGKLVLLFITVSVLAQVFPSCGEETGSVVGWVEEKRVDRSAHAFVIVINHTDYEVPSVFWHQVEIGDLVKWDGKTWTIVKKASESTSLFLRVFRL